MNKITILKYFQEARKDSDSNRELFHCGFFFNLPQVIFGSLTFFFSSFVNFLSG